MKESYHFNPLLLSDREIQEYCSGCTDRMHGLSLLRTTLAQKVALLIEEAKIHEENYRKVTSLYQKEFGK